MNRMKRWIKFKYRPFPIWMFWKNLKYKYDGMCGICVWREDCGKGMLTQHGCYKAKRGYGTI